MVTATKDRHKNSGMMRLDAGTLAKFKHLAGKKTLSVYMRDLADTLEGGLSPSEQSVYENLCSELEKNFDDIRKDLRYQLPRLMRTNKVGKLVELNNTPGIGCQMDQAMLDDALEENPDVQRVGWYDRQPDGSWKFDDVRFGEWLKRDEADRDAMYAAMDAGIRYEHKPTKDTDDWMLETAKGRDYLIKKGREILAKKDKKNDAKG